MTALWLITALNGVDGFLILANSGGEERLRRREGPNSS
jgi:hypothetical protein